MTNSSPDGEGELFSPIRHENRGNAKSCNPREEKCSDTGFSSDGPQQIHLLPTCCPVDHGEEVGEAMAGGKRAHKIQVNVGETSRRNKNSRHRSMNMVLDFSPLATETGTCPETQVPAQPRPNKPGRQEVFERHESQGERSGGVDQRDRGRAPEGQEGGEIQKTRHRARRRL